MIHFKADILEIIKDAKINGREEKTNFCRSSIILDGKSERL
jgi:hypothetical protein